ncbi:hypothetical protein ABFA07_021942 [Porites harrisoni]
MAARSPFLALQNVLESRVFSKSSRTFSTGNQLGNEKGTPIEKKLLEILVCPLSKKPLRYESTTNELISDEIGVAFPIVNGIPNLIPHDGRLLKKDGPTSSKSESDKD